MPTDARRLPGIMDTTLAIGVLDLKSCRDSTPAPSLSREQS